MEVIRTITASVRVIVVVAALPHIVWSTSSDLPIAVTSEVVTRSRAIREDVEALIRKLRSLNRDPNLDMRPEPIQFAREHDEDAQKNVEMAEAQLVSLGKEAFPALIEHMDEQGYSRSIETAVRRNLSIGEVCFFIIDQQVDPAPTGYKVRDGADGKSHSYRGYLSQYVGHKKGNREGMRQWWQERQQLSLREKNTDRGLRLEDPARTQN